MAMLRSTPDLARAVQHLREDHEAFEHRFDDLCARARTDDWRYLDEVWDAFVDDIDDHFAFEEEVLFPVLAEKGPDDRVLVERLLAQHTEVRGTLQQLGVQIQLHEIRAETIDRLVTLLREHAALERERLYSWAEPTQRAS
ncbi:MAG TPA: hemerythrin domain-containing protein [Nannocystaceae bacterium]|nr:hemerythrin domain-containing protein [Nannocystaceae bacterium]